LSTPTRQNDVFLLTLVDFLFQIIFFGFFAFAVSVAADSGQWKSTALAFEEKFKGQSPNDVAAVIANMPQDIAQLKTALADAPQVDRLQRHFGASDLTKLTDELTRMAPVKELRSTSKLIQRAGGVERANEAIDKYLKSGIGKPACLLAEKGKTRAKPLATILGYEDHLEFQAESPELAEVLAKMQVTYSEVQSLPLVQFRRVFGRLGSLYPDCMHTFDFIEKTRYVEPRDAATAGWNVRVIPRKG
jgi:hypothetical protein